MDDHSKVRHRNRFAEAMSHTVRYSFSGKMRLAKDCGVSRMAVSRLIDGSNHPSYHLIRLVTRALEKELGVAIDPQELISYADGEWERSVCEVCGCPGCLPDGALRPDGTIHPAFKDVAPGTWKSYPPSDGELTLFSVEDDL